MSLHISRADGWLGSPVHVDSITFARVPGRNPAPTRTTGS